MGDWISRRSSLVIIAAITALAVVILLAMQRPPICTCGTIELWGEVGPKQSQMLADWYTPSHIVHGFLFYAIGWALMRRRSVQLRLTLAMLVEAGWEIVENTPMVIGRYREATIALGYSGDSVLNSASDILVMAAGFIAARRLPVWTSAVIVVVLELVPLIVIRDNLTLNVWMLVAPNDAILNWQAAA